MSSDEPTLRAIERLRVILPKRAPSLWSAFRDPVSDEDLESLREAIAPWTLPASIETWLRFSDGSPGFVFPVVESAFLSAQRMIDGYQVTSDVYPSGLLPFSYSSHVQASIVLDAGGPPLIVDTTLAQVEWRLLAPSFASLLGVIADMAETGVLATGYPPAETRSMDLPDELATLERLDAQWKELARGQEWGAVPFAPIEWFDAEQSPPSWGPWPTS